MQLHLDKESQKKRDRLVNGLIGLWLTLWIVLLTRPSIANLAEVAEALEMLRETPEFRRQKSYGEELYQFQKLCTQILPETARFQIIGLEIGSQDHSRLLYLLYPRVLSDQPGYLLVYHLPSYSRPGTLKLASFGNGDLILRIENKESP
jgi:hypothetical protein